jgi:D-galactarolactone cycloisomerase
MSSHAIKTTLTRLEAFAFRAPTPRPVSTSFGIMRDRPAVFLRLEDKDGAFGWGEVFANWPAAGAEHRARLAIDDVAPLVIGRNVAHPTDLFTGLTKETHIRALQCAEWGPFRQVIAALDQALWDLAARRAQQPVAQFIRDTAPSRVPAYASGIHVNDGAATIPEATARQGFRYIKLKVGFDLTRDIDSAAAAHRALTPHQRIMFDANQAWDAPTAIAQAKKPTVLNPVWLEEPILADATPEAWARVAAEAGIPIAGGENIAGEAEFEHAARSGVFAFIQPDIAKWGGLSGNLIAAHAARAHGRVMCPHFLGGGIGLVASAHFLAAAGGDGLLEVDVNANPLRDGFFDGAPVSNGHFTLRAEPGYGITTLPDALKRYETWRGEARA